MILDGPFTELSSYPFFGDPIHSATAGRVVGIQKGLPETQPGVNLPPARRWRAGGNYVVVKMDNGRFAFYAHLQPGSTTVKVGDRVRTGQVLGRLGSSGNSNFPHLHFHLMSGPEPLASTVSRTGSGSSGSKASSRTSSIYSTARRPNFPGRHAGRKKARLPLNLQVLDFGK